MNSAKGGDVSVARKPKVLLLTTELDFGGVEVGNLKRAFALRDFGYEPEFACLHKLGKIGRELQENGFPVHCLESSPKIPNLQTFWRLVKLLRKLRPDIVHAACIEAVFFGLVAARFVGGIKVIGEEVGILIDGKGNNVRRWKGRQVGRFAWRNVDMAFAVAECVRKSMIDTEGAPPENTIVVPYSIDPAYVQPSRNGSGNENAREVIVGCVARLSPEKGQRTLLPAFAQASKTRPNLRLWLVGDGPDRSYLEEMAADLGIAESVKFWGTRRDIPELLKQMDMFVLASLWEGLPNALLEAMASSVPIIASRVGGVPEVVKDEDNGFLVTVGSVEELARTIIRVADFDVSERNKITKTAQQTVMSRFSPEVVTEQLSDLYGGLIASRAL